jgi:prefoldin subunit 2
MAEGGGDKMEMMSEQAVAGKWNFMRSELNQLYGKINELEQELNEHQLVINAIQPLDPGRKCFRMIGGVLVERTVGEVLPAVNRNKEGLQEVITRLTEALEKKTKEFAAFEAKYKIKVRGKGDDVVPEKAAKESAAQGVLV